MSRQIKIGYRLSASGEEAPIELRAPYFLFGTQRTSQAFWSLPIWNMIGVSRLAELGDSDPVYFFDWIMLDLLKVEIRFFNENLSTIEFDPDVKSWFLAHLVYSHSLLVSSAPKDLIPQLTIG